MRTSVLALPLLALVSLGPGVETLQRRKRFLSPESWSRIPEGLLRLGDQARQFTTRTLDGLLTEASRDSPLVSRRPSPLESIFGDTRRVGFEHSKKKSNTERETEDDSEVIVEEPHKETDEMPSYNPFNIPLSFSFGLFTPWWKGPNVCIERNEVDEEEEAEEKGISFNINFESTQCIPSEAAYVCTKKIRNSNIRKSIVIKYQCCHGYVRRKDGKPGCSEVKMDDIMQTLRTLEATKFASLLESTPFAEKLMTENFTIFAPSNDAVTDFEEETENNEILELKNKKRRNKDLSDFVGGHLVEGFVNLALTENDQVLNSMNGKTTIRVNKYRPGEQVVTANCVPVSMKDNFATNGLVHLATDVLPLPRKTITEIITASPQFSIFSKLLAESDLFDDLKDPKKSWTLFVPSDDAFKSMDKDMLQRLLSGGGCVESVLRNHVLQGTVCSHAVAGRAHIQNYLGKPLTLSRDEIEKLKVNGISVNTTNVLGTNGVVHFIDEVMVPSAAYNILESLDKSGRQDLLELIEAADMSETFRTMDNFTFFAPSKDAIKGISNKTRQEWEENPTKLSEILTYHMAAPKTLSSAFRHNKEVSSLSRDHQIRIQLHELFPGIAVAATAQCSLVVKHDGESCGAVVHTVDKILMPPRGSIVDTLKGMEDHEILRKLLEGTELEAKLNNEEEGPYTMLAPTDKAFQRFEKGVLEDLMENKTQAEQILRMHVLPEPLCCRGVHHTFPFSHHYVRTLEGNLLSLHRSGRHDRIRFGPSRVVECDLPAKNGLVHSVNRVILPNRRPTPSLLDLDIFRLF